MSGEDVNGIGPKDLADHALSMDLGALGLLQTAVEVRVQGGKPRLRLIGNGIQLHRQLAAALLLPEPVRADEAMGAGEPVIQRDRYAVETLHITTATPVGHDQYRLLPVRLVARNRSNYAEEIGIADRVATVVHLWAQAFRFPDDIAALLAAHEKRCRAGGPAGAFDENLVRDLQSRAAERSGDLQIIYSETADVVPALVQALKLEIPPPLLRIEDVDPEDLLLKRRTAKEWKRWANARGPASARFRSEVRTAYKATCILCGVRYPPTSVSAAGVDAAHILPWADYDLDSVPNGICLCKTHHWAFDESLLRLMHDGSQYIAYVEDSLLGTVAADAPEFSLDEVRRHVGPIPYGRLPENPSDWPRPDLLNLIVQAG